MSFSSSVKEELAHQKSVRKCCQIAELSAIIRVDGSLHLLSGELAKLSVSTQSSAVARKIIYLLRELFCLKSEATIRRSKFRRDVNYLVEVPRQPHLDQSLNELGILNDSLSLNQQIAPRLVKKNCCAASYLRGLFLGTGFVGSPLGNYHLELSIESRYLANQVLRLLDKLSLTGKLYQRRSYWVVYLKDSNQIGRFLVTIGAYSALLRWEDWRILKALRAQANRLVNCDTANLNRSVEAAIRQISDINYIDERIGLKSLPPILFEIACLRLAHPNSSLAELGELSQPKLSKSATNHRFRRLRSLANHLRQKDNYLSLVSKGGVYDN
jgi:hypothetical protein